MKNNIPKYFLYGEAPHDVELDFMQVEPIRRRSGAHNWIISPHSHPNHMQFLLINQGGGTFRIDDKKWDVTKQSLILVPAGCVHDMSFTQDTDGLVITAASTYISSLAGNDNRFITTAQKTYIKTLTQDIMIEFDIENTFERIHKEFVWSAKGRRAAIKAHLINLLVTYMRLEEEQHNKPETTMSRDQQLVLRFREEIEKHFRVEKKLDFYYRNIGVSSSRLHDACSMMTNMSPSAILHERLIIESKRLILYSAATIAEISYKLGFEDPAYFARFFTKRAGMSPSKFRQNGTQ
jgi:AraC family transcriptional regulator, transcriptional activator of pobA